ncbi:MAG TPA: Asp-tRNA(Asn)/Glu-tRNA(Gln) amidotransferase subunit GatB [Chitinophagaceae bacterium]|nr:Asp-tRNA(Asn)/Glu-tRNA(Gln) amidotransferase subunit GatB [Chitinophagaceae bacterium]
MTDQQAYEVVVGLEVHVQLLTKSKLFCGDSTAFGAEPNTSISPITLAHPGTLPKMNKEAIGFAIKMGLACNATIAKENYFARKHYFYPDLPKGFQVSQHTTPICSGGYIPIQIMGGEKKIRLNRIHLEEDAGKSLHDADDNYTNIDLNRAGTPLIEIVSEPDIRNGEEAVAFLNVIRKWVRYLDISDGNMEEGSLRCDANISIRKRGESRLGTKVEVKNLNSIRFVKKAIESEASRLMALESKGEKIIQQTRSFDAGSGTTFAIRDKEDADDYRYFPEPDLTPFRLEEAYIDSFRQTLPRLQEERISQYISALQLPEYDARVITEEKKFSDYFDTVIASIQSKAGDRNISTAYKAAANWMLGPIRSWLNEQDKTVDELPLLPVRVADMVELVESGKLSFSIASTRLFDLVLENGSSSPESLAIKHNLLQQSDAFKIEPVVDELISQWPDKLAEYRKGKKGLLSLFVGEVMKRTRGKADPKVVNDILLRKLKEG